MKISIHQAAYLPWLGYLSRIAESDVFVFLDTVQFEKNSFTNRNRIKTSSGPLWLTVPVLQKGHLSKSCFDIRIDSHQDWKKKHLKSIEANYRKTVHFPSRFSELQELFVNSHDRLADLCYWQLLFWLSKFEIQTPVIRASSLPVSEKKSDLVLEICKHFNATEYLSGPLGKNYLSAQDFEEANVQIKYQDYVHPIYPQLYGEFITGMSVVDSWMNCLDPALLIKKGLARSDRKLGSVSGRIE